ncbi:MAG TPA: copper homeostasis membrane protein CopD [Alphaproteobacteria bacterium]|nr:copper homeostasis membrane protein CopD [Alphaproteobacteria bacterium]
MWVQQIVEPSFFLSAVARACHYASTLLLFGTFAFAIAIARPTANAVGNSADECRILRQFLLRSALAGLIAALFTGAVLFWITAAGVSGKSLADALAPQVLGDFLVKTNFGQVWQLRLAIAALLAIALMILLHRSAAKESPVGEALGGGLAAVLLASLALVGHSNDRLGTAGGFRLGVDMLHLLAAGAWLGSLPGLAYVLTRVDDPKSSIRFRIARDAVERFSTLGIVCVAVILLTGIANSWFLVGSVPALVGTDYGHILLVKLALFLLLLTLAAFNRQRYAPQLASSDRSGAYKQAVIGRLRRNTIAEIVVGLAILGAVGALVAAAPAAGEQPDWPFPYQLDMTVFATANLSLKKGFGIIFLKAGVLALAGVLAIAWSFYHRAWGRFVAGFVAIGIAAAIPARYALIEAYPTSFYRSPIAYDTASIARGRLLYFQNCAICHGPHGYGDGPAAAALPVTPADLTSGHFFHHGEGVLFWWISNGVKNTPMPAFGDRLDENRRWDLVNFLRAQADVEQANVMTYLVQPFQPIVAPDIAFQLHGRDQETLSGLRGKTNVLLIFYSVPDSLTRIETLGAARPSLEAAGLRMIAIPMENDTEVLLPEDLAAQSTFLAEPDPDAVATYTLFRRVPSGGENSSPLRHIEFLIDRAGYLRARWIPGERKGWSDLAMLQRQIDELMHEPLRRPPPENHLH